MSALPPLSEVIAAGLSIQPTAALAHIIEQLQGARSDLALSPAEAAFAPEAKTRPVGCRDNPLVEEDCEITASGGLCLLATLRVYGRLTPASYGKREGGRPIEPDEPAGVDIDEVTLSLGDGEVALVVPEADGSRIENWIMDRSPNPDDDAPDRDEEWR